MKEYNLYSLNDGELCSISTSCSDKVQTLESLKYDNGVSGNYQYSYQLAKLLDQLINLIEYYRQDTNFIRFKTSLKRIKQTLITLPQVMIVGSFSTGKSTFLNALFGADIATVGALPTTAVTTKISYGTDKKVLVYFKDGLREEYSISDFKRVTSEIGGEGENFYKSILYVECFLPFEILKSFSIIDSPGLDAKNEHTEQTKRFIERADVILWMFSVENAVSAREFDAIKALDIRYKPVAILNKIDTLDEEEDDLDDIIISIWEKLDEVVDYIYPISAQMAFFGKINNSISSIEESQILAVEKFLQTEVMASSEFYRIQVFLDAFSLALFRLFSDFDFKLVQDVHNKALLDTIRKIDGVVQNFISLTNIEGRGSIELYKAILSTFIFNTEYPHESCCEKSQIILMMECFEESAARGNLLAEALLAFTSLWAEETLGISGNSQILLDSVEKKYKTNKFYLDHYALDQFYNISDSECVSSQGTLAILLAKKYENSDFDKYFHYLKEGYEAGCHEIMAKLAYAYESKGDIKMALSFWKKIAISDCNEQIRYMAYNNMGLIYYKGEGGITKNLLQSIELFKMASLSGNAEYIFNYAEALLQSEFGEINPLEVTERRKEAIELLESVRRECTFAAHELMFIYYQGIYGIDKSFSKAMQIARQAPEVNKEMTMLKAFIFLEGGFGVKQNLKMAFKLVKDSDEPGRFYIEGILAHKQGSIDKARVLIEKAANMGFQPAIDDLSRGLHNITYLPDKGVNRDIVSSYENIELGHKDKKEKSSKENIGYALVFIVFLISLMVSMIISSPKVGMGVIALALVAYIVKKD